MRIGLRMFRLGLAAAVLALTGCASLMLSLGVSLKTRVGEPSEILTSKRAEGWGVYSHPYMFNLPNAGLLLFCNAESDSATGRKFVLNSTDGGAAWVRGAATNWVLCPMTNGQETIFGPMVKNGLVLTVGAVGTFGDGSVVAQFWIVGGGENSSLPSNSSYRFCSRDMRTWDPPEVSRFEFPTGFTGMALGLKSVAEEPDTLWAAAYGYPNKSSKYTTVLIQSKDRGRTWRCVSTIATPDDAPWGGEGPCEPDLLRLPTGEWLCVMRTGGLNYAGRSAYSDKMLLARSRDNGKTWRYTKLTVPGVMPKLLRMSNGVLVCAFGRPGNSLVFSLDDGRTWGHEIALTAADIQTTGYCDIAEVSPGRLLAIYDVYDAPYAKIWLWEPKTLNGILGTFVDVQRR